MRVSNRTGSVTESIKPTNFLKLNHPVFSKSANQQMLALTIRLLARIIKVLNLVQDYFVSFPEVKIGDKDNEIEKDKSNIQKRCY